MLSNNGTDSSLKISIETTAKLFATDIKTATTFNPFLRGTLKLYQITTRERIACFCAQLAHESGGLTTLQENLNYSEQGLIKTWPNRFDSTNARIYAKNPQKIANKVYANRMGNGDESSGDGWKYRGRGCIQITGKDNYRMLSKDLGIDFIAEPDLLLLPVNAMLSAGWFWDKSKLNAIADRLDHVLLTKRINGGSHGLDQRIERTKNNLVVLSNV